MTIIITATTHDYVLLASDRRLTAQDKNGMVSVVDDDTCKLVALCDSTVIGYTGRGSILGVPTHEWTARVLAEANCCEMPEAVLRLQASATHTFRHFPKTAARHAFLFAGWTMQQHQSEIQPYVCVVSNFLSSDGSYLDIPNAEFRHVLQLLPFGEDVRIGSVGAALPSERTKALVRGMRRLVAREIGPTEALRLLVAEIAHLSKCDPNGSVGEKVLACCIPKKSVSLVRPGKLAYLAKQPDLTSATFAYFDGEYAPALQYGPTAT